MSWNEPGGDNNDPWSGRGDQKGPPNLDEIIIISSSVHHDGAGDTY